LIRALTVKYNEIIFSHIPRCIGLTPRRWGLISLFQGFLRSHTFLDVFIFSLRWGRGASTMRAAPCVRLLMLIQKMRPASKNSGGPRHAHFVLAVKRQHEIEVRVPIYFVAALLMFTNNKKRIIFTSWTYTFVRNNRLHKPDEL
jgi:hypothetical protein